MAVPYPPHFFPETLCVLSIIKPPVPLTTATPIAFVSAWSYSFKEPSSYAANIPARAFTFTETDFVPDTVTPPDKIAIHVIVTELLKSSWGDTLKVAVSFPEEVIVPTVWLDNVHVTSNTGAVKLSVLNDFVYV
jgi:hypothetical protein